MYAQPDPGGGRGGEEWKITQVRPPHVGSPTITETGNNYTARRGGKKLLSGNQEITRTLGGGAKNRRIQADNPPEEENPNYTNSYTEKRPLTWRGSRGRTATDSLRSTLEREKDRGTVGARSASSSKKKKKEWSRTSANTHAAGRKPPGVSCRCNPGRQSSPLAAAVVLAFLLHRKGEGLKSKSGEA